MSSYDEWTPLEEAVRRKRPSALPLPSAFKQHLRHQLLEEADMMHKRQIGSGFTKLATGLGAAVFLLLIPILFWLSLGQQRAAFAPLAASSEEAADGAQTAENRADITHIGPAQVLDAGRVEVALTLVYTLVDTSEATIYLHYTAQDEGGTFYGERLLPVVGASGEVETTVDLPALAAHADGTLKDEVVFTAEIVPAGTIPDNTMGAGDNYAILASVGTAVAHEGDETLMDLPVQIEYKVTDYEKAVILAGYDDTRLEMIEMGVDAEGNVLEEAVYIVDGDGNQIPVETSGSQVTVDVTQGEGTIYVILPLPVELFNDEGELNDEVEVWASLKVAELAP